MTRLGLDCSKRSPLAQALQNALALRRRYLVQAKQLVHRKHFGRPSHIALAPVAAFPTLNSGSVATGNAIPQTTLSGAAGMPGKLTRAGLFGGIKSPAKNYGRHGL